MSNSVSGMAARIRAATESETFDLAGQNATTISNTIQAAFSDPFFSLDEENDNEMIRITFIVGAGKQARQKYDSDAIKAVTSTLRDIVGYEEDRTASCVRECAGLYKLQHDTAKNLKTVVVFPKLLKTTSGYGGGNDDDNDDNSPPLIQKGSIEDRIATSSLSVFQNMIKSKCPSWTQKKGCMGVLESLREPLNELDSKLVKGTTPLTPSEQSFWESIEALDDKEAYLKGEMLAQVESGQITHLEHDTLLQHNAERIASIRSDMKKANGGTKRQKQQLEKALARRDLLEQIEEPLQPHKLRNDAAIRKLWKELMPLLRAEQQFRGRLLNVKESKMMGRKEELQEEIEQLEESSRGWFEDDSFFQSRVDACRANFVIKSSGGKKSTSGSTRNNTKSYAAATTTGAVTSIGSSTTTKVSKWVTPGETGKKSKSPKKLGKAKGADVFSRMVIDSDEDDDDDDDDEENRHTTPPLRREPEARDEMNQKGEQSPNQKSPSKKKKKKKKKGGTKVENMTEEEAMQRAIEVNVAAEEDRKKKEVEDTSWWSLIASLLLAILVWLLSLITSPFKTKATSTKKKR